MKSSNIKFTGVEVYISKYPEDIQNILQQIRAAIKKAATKSVEVISYGMPAFKQSSCLLCCW